MHNKIGCLLLIVLATIISACQSTPTVTEQWVPLYLQLYLYEGKAQVQWSGESEWTILEGETDITIVETCRIIADAVEGAKFYMNDGSLLELDPGTVIETKNPGTLPRLQVTLRDGTLLFTAQEHSYELFTPICPISLLSIPSQIEIEVNGDTTRLAVEEGAATCALEEETFTLPTCREILLRADEEPEVSEFCVASTATPPAMVTLSPSPTPWWSDSTQTLTHTPTPTPTATMTPTPAPTIVVLPTDTPLPPPTATPRPRREPTKPPPTSTPKPQPTSTPKPQPTSTPKPQPTDPQPTAVPNTPRPTPEPPRPTPSS
ncbi:MAG: FecR domain-containing protein [Chloroflexi bacterium]|nr:FecR domain-containing protein [Chloroflexota bacterium]